MADGTHIEWTDATWNPITGCSIVSPGCTNCYAMKLAGTRLKHHASRAGLTRDTKAGPVWNDEVRFNPQWLDQPLHWAKPRMIFVCAHGDLFHPMVPDEWIDQIFAVMALSPQHVFQVLTKRPERMRAYVKSMEDCFHGNSDLFQQRWGNAAADVTFSPCAAGAIEDITWPLPNVWLGVSVEDQRRAAERIPALLQTPSAIRWISAEPLLGPVDLIRLDVGFGYGANALAYPSMSGPGRGIGRLDWVVAGGESGAGARPIHPDWARKIRDQCADAGVPFLFKQWGNWRQWTDVASGFQNCSRFDRFGNVTEARARLHLPYRNGFTQPEGDFPWHGEFLRFDKQVAGRLLDGVEHNGFPPLPTSFTETHR